MRIFLKGRKIGECTEEIENYEFELKEVLEHAEKTSIYKCLGMDKCLYIVPISELNDILKFIPKDLNKI